MEGKQKKIKGITLIALVVTIVVLLILAGVSIAMLTGDNGIIVQAKRAREENTKGEIKEELELEIADMRTDKASKGEELTKQEVIDKMTEKGVIITDSEGDIIQGEYKDYEITIDENYNVIVGGALTGAKPQVTLESLNTEADADSVQIKVTASTTEGEIASIEATNGAVLKTDTSSTEKIFEVTKNGKYYFKVKGTNGRTTIESIEITNIYTGGTSLLEAISGITKSGEQEAAVRGKTSAGAKETKVYKLNVLYSKNDLVLDGTTPAVLDDGETQITVAPNSKVYYFGSAGDIGTASENAKNTVVLKVEGNLTINSGVKVTSVGSNYGGPKGMIIYCTGTLTNNGEISMTARGAKAVGENVYLWQNEDGSYEYVPAIGGAGGIGVRRASGNSGSNGIARSTRWWRFRRSIYNSRNLANRKRTEMVHHIQEGLVVEQLGVMKVMEV